MLAYEDEDFVAFGQWHENNLKRCAAGNWKVELCRIPPNHTLYDVRYLRTHSPENPEILSEAEMSNDTIEITPKEPIKAPHTTENSPNNFPDPPDMEVDVDATNLPETSSISQDAAQGTSTYFPDKPETFSIVTEDSEIMEAEIEISPNQQEEPIESPEKLPTVTPTIPGPLTANSLKGLQVPSVFYLDGCMLSRAHVVDWSKPGMSKVQTIGVNFHNTQINNSQCLSNSLNLISDMMGDNLIHVLGDNHRENVSGANNSKIGTKFKSDLCNRLLRVAAKMVDSEITINHKVFKSSAATSKKFSNNNGLKLARGISNINVYIFSLPKFLRDFLGDNQNDEDLKRFVNELEYLFHVSKVNLQIDEYHQQKLKNVILTFGKTNHFEELTDLSDFVNYMLSWSTKGDFNFRHFCLFQTEVNIKGIEQNMKADEDKKRTHAPTFDFEYERKHSYCECNVSECHHQIFAEFKCDFCGIGVIGQTNLKSHLMKHKKTDYNQIMFEAEHNVNILQIINNQKFLTPDKLNLNRIISKVSVV